MKSELKNDIAIISEGHSTYSNFGNKSISMSDEPYLILEPGTYLIRVKVYRGKQIILL